MDAHNPDILKEEFNTPALQSFIAPLPEEILEIILAKVKSNVSSEEWWASCMRTCRQWHRIGLGLHKGLGYAIPVILESQIRREHVVEEHLALDCALISDYNFQPPSGLFAAQLRSLTIHVRHQRVATPFCSRPGVDMIDRLCKDMSRMPILTTFSLKFSDGWDFPTLNVPAIPQSWLARVVSVLPDTVVDLELDTACTEIPPSLELIHDHKENHMCYQISKIIRRLRHLRLRTQHVCQQLFGFIPDQSVCLHASSCGYCSSNHPSICQLIRSWNMRTMVIWLPWVLTNLSENDINFLGTDYKFHQAARALCDPAIHNPTIVLFVQQFHPDARIMARNPRNIAEVHRCLCCQPRSNLSTEILLRLPAYFNFRQIASLAFKADRFQDIRRRTRRFQLTLGQRPGPRAEPGGDTTYTYLAVATVEAMLSWTQRAHLSYRFPICESDTPDKMWFKKPELWYCNFPGCVEQPLKSLVALRGHSMYAHPFDPHEHESGSVLRGCPLYGCDMVGERGLFGQQEMVEHLRKHGIEKEKLSEIVSGA